MWITLWAYKRANKSSLRQFTMTFSRLTCKLSKLNGMSLSFLLEQNLIKENKQLNPSKTKQQQRNKNKKEDILLSELGSDS